jgi:hypothetical protein
LVRIPGNFARQALEGYLDPARSGWFNLAERHLEPPGATDTAAFKLGRASVPFPSGGPAASIDRWQLRVPHCLPAALAAAASALSFGPAWRRRKRRRHGLCVRCGYDLRSSIKVCPECGEPILSAAAARE